MPPALQRGAASHRRCPPGQRYCRSSSAAQPAPRRCGAAAPGAARVAPSCGRRGRTRRCGIRASRSGCPRKLTLSTPLRAARHQGIAHHTVLSHARAWTRSTKKRKPGSARDANWTGFSLARVDAAARRSLLAGLPADGAALPVALAAECCEHAGERRERDQQRQGPQREVPRERRAHLGRHRSRLPGMPDDRRPS